MKRTLFIFIIFPALKIWAQTEEPQQNLVIDNIVCQGNAKTDCDFIKKEFYQNPGDLLNEEEVQNAKIRLKLKNLFETVDIFLKKEDQKYHVSVIIDVIEKDPTFTETTLNSGMDYPFQSNTIGITYGNRNLLGNGETLTGSIEFQGIGDSEYQNALGKIEYTTPHFLGTKDYFFNTSIEQRKNIKRPEVLPNEASTSYSDKITTYTLGGGKRIFDFSYISILLTHSVANIKTQVDSNDSLYSSSSNSIDLAYGWSTENDTYFATTGEKFSLSYNKTLYSQDDDTQESYQSSYSKRFLLSSKSSVRLALAGYTSIYKNLYNDSRLSYINPTAEYSYQFIDSTTDKSSFIQRAKFYYSISSIKTFATDYPVSYQHQELGFLMDSKKFGIIKLFLTNWSLL